MTDPDKVKLLVWIMARLLTELEVSARSKERPDEDELFAMLHDLQLSDRDCTFAGLVK